MPKPETTMNYATDILGSINLAVIKHVRRMCLKYVKFFCESNFANYWKAFD